MKPAHQFSKKRSDILAEELAALLAQGGAFAFNELFPETSVGAGLKGDEKWRRCIAAADARETAHVLENRYGNKKWTRIFGGARRIGRIH